MQLYLNTYFYIYHLLSKGTQKDPRGTQKDFIKHVKLKIDAIIISIKVFYISLDVKRPD